MNTWKKTKKSTLISLASLACFTGVTSNLLGVGVTVSDETGTITDCSDCGTGGNDCCTFLDAFNYIGAFVSPGPVSAQTIDLTQQDDFNPHTINYVDSIDASYITVYGSQITIYGGNQGGVVNFNGVDTSNGDAFDFRVGPDTIVILQSTVFQNTTPNGHAIFNSGTLEITGTNASTANANGVFFENVAWDMGLTGDTVSLIFAAPTHNAAYSVPFPGTIYIGAGQTDTTLHIQNSSGYTVTVSGDVFGDDGCPLTIQATNPLLFTGAVNTESLTLTSGTAEFSGSVLAERDTTITADSGTVLTFSGSVIGSNAATLTIDGTGTNTFSGSMQVEGDTTLSVSSGVVATFSGSVVGSNGATLTIAGAGTASIATIEVDGKALFTVDGNIKGTSTLTKTGTGALLLTGTSDYSGKTYVNQGILIVDGDITASGDPIVEVGGLLTGTGDVGGTDVFGGIKGGNVLGTLTVNGDLILETGSHFGTLVTPTDNTLVDVTTDVTINTGVDYVVLFEPGSYNIASRVILTSGGTITGTFSTINRGAIGPYFLSAVLDYSSNEVTLGLAERLISPLASGGNAVNVAGALDESIAFNRANVTYTLNPGPTLTASPPDEVPGVLISLLPFTTEPTMTHALNQLHPAQLKGMAIVQENNAVRVRESLTQRIINELNIENCLLDDSDDANGKKCCDRNQQMMNVWVSGLGDTLVQDNKTNSWGPLAGYRANTGGAIVGIDVMFADHFYAGVLGAYTNSNVHFKQGKGTGSISTGYAGVYFSAVGSGDIGKMFYVNTAVIGGWSEYRGERHIQYPGVDLDAKNHHGGSQILSHLDTGLNWDFMGLTVRPFDSFDYISQQENKYHESNAGDWELTISDKNATMIRNELGLQFAKCYCFSGSKWIISPKFSWVREIRIKGDGFSVSFTDAGNPFYTQGYFPDRNLFAPGLGVTGMMMKDALMFDLYYNGEFTGGYSSNSIGGQIAYSF